MKKTKRTQIASVLGIITIMAMIGFGLIACGGGDDGGDSNGGGNGNGTEVAVTGVTVAPETLALTVGGSDTLVEDIAPSNATNTNVTWSSSNTSVATVNNGTVNAIAAGTATITVTTIDGGKTATCAVTVTAVSTPVTVTGVTLDKTTLTIEVGEHETLHQTVAPADATNKAVTWSTSNAAVATVNNGTVTAVNAGTATITVTTTDGSKTATCAVTVTAASVHEYAIGDTGPGGGKIIYVSASGFNVAGLGTCHYLEAAPENQARNVTWSSTKVDVTGATGTAIGTGKANTAAIIAAHSGDTTSNNAAKACADYTGGGKSDWFLPSKDELNEMYKARSHLNNSSNRFWSSSQIDYDNAWYQLFSTGAQTKNIKDFNLNYVRAIRAF